jgi:hypothetical protein
VWNTAGPLLPVEGFSSFLHMFVVGALYGATGIDLEWIGKALGLLFTLATIVSIGWTSRRAGLTTAGVLVALSPFMAPPMIMASGSGMETTLYVMLAWLTPLSCLRVLTGGGGRGRVETFVGLALLGTLTRPEFAMNALALFALTAWRKPEVRGSLVGAILLFYVLPGLAVTGWRFHTYGDIVPNTFYVKQRLPGLWGLGYVWRFALICALPYLLIAAPSFRRLWKDHRDLLLIVIVSVGLPCLYFTSVRPLMGWWYRFLIPQLPLLAFLAGVSLSAAPARSRVAAGLRLAGASLVAIFGLMHVPVILHDVPIRSAEDNRLDEIGRRLRPLAAPDRSFSYYDIGRLPYSAGWTVVDVVGLATSRKDLRGDCANNTDLLLRAMNSSPPVPEREIENPCPRLYEPLVDLVFLTDVGSFSRRMRVFVRKDIAYREPLRRALADGWPEPFVQDAGWLTDFDGRFGEWFGR